jgi:Protein of unknown function (DUF3298)
MTRVIRVLVVGCALSVVVACSGNDDDATIEPVVTSVSIPPTTVPTTVGTSETVPPPSTDVSSPDTQVVTEPSPPLIVESQSDQGTTQGWTWVAGFPELSGPEGAPVVADAIEAEVRAQISFRTDGDFQPGPDEQPYTAESIAQVREWNDLIVARIDGYEYTGGAHPNSWVTTMVFEAATGDRVGLNDLLGGDYLAVLADAAQTQLADIEPYPEGIEPTERNFAAWEPIDDGMLVTFQPYQVGPYALGLPTITVPWDAFDSVTR